MIRKKEFKESEVVEFKKSLSQLDDALKSVCGFLNHKGGKVYFGVDGEGGVVGLDGSDKVLRQISQQISSRISPQVVPEVREIRKGGKRVIEVVVREGSNKPYFLDGR